MKYIIIMSFFTALFGSNTSKNSTIKVLSSEEFKAQTENKVVQLIDVRTPGEFKSGHINGAKNIDFYSGKFNIEFNKLNKNEAVYVYCRSGSRSRQTSKKLEAMGFTEIYDLKGGILNYK
ncbi:rhodanese-like domain-containing protein [Oceanihabitans sp. 2_MG-2023]|uniref:rhodanese-like domain-containing protein n=1 Tax=Oceanihabitans sp. 2_MG-2023 TaxID=3062661 RepID=UPI0026E3F2F8|nr:rhodanese-like domain-containing protein [Oceanihabitans sp. 2_MG-2023]MDO6597409.1 rhodanese-like domain-containing protein [Oceanihabitans sp. 2_MG-2023]